MPSPGSPTLDQLVVLVTVSEEGSFTRAAARLGRAVSAISYAIDALEAQLGTPLFLRGAARKPTLTQAGIAILGEAKGVVQSFETLRARASGLLNGLEAEVTLVMDPMGLGADLTAALADFHAAFPTVPVKLLVQPQNGVERVLRRGDADIGVGNPMHMDLTGLRHAPVASVRIIPVAAPSHPLAAPGHDRESTAASHVQLILIDPEGRRGRDFGVVSQATWRIADMGVRLDLLLRGIGWGGMPEPLVAADLRAGRLVRLDLEAFRGGDYPLHAVYGTAKPPGPAGRWLFDRLGALYLRDRDGQAPAATAETAQGDRKGLPAVSAEAQRV